MHRNAVILHTALSSTVVLAKVTMQSLYCLLRYMAETLCARTSQLQIDRALLCPDRSTTYV